MELLLNGLFRYVRVKKMALINIIITGMIFFILFYSPSAFRTKYVIRF